MIQHQNVSRRANTSSLARFPSTASSTRTGRGPIPLSINRSSATPSSSTRRRARTSGSRARGTGTRTGSRTTFGAGIVVRSNLMIENVLSGRRIFPEMWPFSRITPYRTTHLYRRLRMGRSSARSSRPIEGFIIEGVLLCMEMLLEVARWGGTPKHRMD